MKIKKKLLIALLSATCLTAGAMAIAGCDEGDTGVAVRDSYLVTLYENETNGGTTMTYEQWLESKFAAGKDGNDGVTPTIGENGNWFIGDTDTGISAIGKDGANGSNGVNGADGADGRGVESITLIDSENSIYVIKFTDGTSAFIDVLDGQEYSIRTANALGDDGKPVAGAYLKLSYYDTNSYITKQLATAKTDANGQAIFIYKPVEGAIYQVGLSDYGATESDTALPYGYDIISSAYYKEGETSVTVNFTNVEGTFGNAVTHNAIVRIPYSRVYDFSSTEKNPAPVETNGTASGTFTITLTGGVNTYLCFNSYVSPETTEDDDKANDEILANANRAASGIYKFTITGGDATLTYYSGSVANTILDENGVPALINMITGTAPAGASEEEVKLYSGDNSITINNDTSVSRSDKIFGLYAEKSCKVTITVERLGDAKEIPVPEIIPIAVPANIAVYPEKQAGETLTDMPVTGAFEAVYNPTDGFYHVNGVNGPVLLVQLKNPVSRYSDLALQNFAQSSIMGEAVLQLSGTDESDYDEDGNLLYRYDYNAVLAAYCAKANSDGVYGVDSVMYDMLTALAARGEGLDIASAAKGYGWLLACQYYAPQGGLPVNGEGTEESPFIVANGNNTIDMSKVSGSATIAFTAPTAGMYSFEVVTSESGFNISSSDASVATLLKTKTNTITNAVTYTFYVCVEEGRKITCTVSGSALSYSVNVAACATTVAVSGDSSSASSGIDEATAIPVTANVYCIKIDKSVNEDGVYLSLAPTMGNVDATYSFELVSAVQGEDANCYIEYGDTKVNANATTPLTIENASYPESYVVHIDAQTTSYVILRINKVS